MCTTNTIIRHAIKYGVASREQNIHAIVTEPVDARRDCPFAMRNLSTVRKDYDFRRSLSLALQGFSLPRLLVLFLAFIFFMCTLRARSSTHPENRRGRKIAVLKIDDVGGVLRT